MAGGQPKNANNSALRQLQNPSWQGPRTRYHGAMSTQLIIHTVATQTANRFSSYWTVGRKQGIVEITITDQALPDQIIVAELAALKYLLSEKAVLGHDRGGNSMVLEVTFGAIRKLAQGATAKKHLTLYGRFLQTRYADAKITVSKNSRWIDAARAEHHRETLTVSEPKPEVINIPTIGPVGISHHLVERLMERANYATVAAAWHHLRRMLTNPRVCVESLSQAEARDKQEKHHAAARYLQIPGEAWRFVMTAGERSRGGMPMLVTAYVR